MYGYNKELFSADGFYVIPTLELAYSYVLAGFSASNIATQFAISAVSAGVNTSVQITLPKTGMPE